VEFRPGSFLSLSPGGFHRIAYLEWGAPTAPQLVVCVHGLSRNSRDFDYLAASLAERSRVVCVDVVGRGDSDWLADKSDYRFTTYLADAASLIARITAPAPPASFGTFRRLRPPVDGPAQIDWVGTSMGGLIGMLLAAKAGSPIRRLVLNDVGAFIPWGAMYRLKGYVAGGTRFADIAAVEAYLRDACAPFGPLSDEHWRHMATHSAQEMDGGGFQLRYDPGIGDMMRGGQPDPELPLGPNYLSGIDLWGVWREIRCPVLVLRGETSDVLSRDTLARMQALKPDTEVREFDSVGHAPALMSYDQIEAVRAFLQP
jgi:pimeloyl-ACP methyl ester carboxylesterase